MPKLSFLSSKLSFLRYRRYVCLAEGKRGALRRWREQKAEADRRRQAKAAEEVHN